MLKGLTRIDPETDLDTRASRPLYRAPQNWTFHAAVQESALPPKADIAVAVQNVRFVP
jgi:hypothetical protein